MPTPISKTQARIEEWKKKLIDLTRRNRLLFFSPGRKSTLRIINPSSAEVFQRLVMDEKEWGFYPPKDADSELEDSNISISARHAEQGLLWNDQSKKVPQGLSASVQDSNTLNVILRNLYRRSNSDLKERGIRTLHVTFGMLKWHEKNDSDFVITPLLLIPAELHRESVNSPYQLKIAEDEADVIMNPALQVKLEKDFNIKLPSLPESWEEEALQRYIKSIGPRFQSLGWEVLDECWIGLFSFHKLVMYKDLEEHEEQIKQHAIVRMLCKEPLANDSLNANCPDPEKLDEIVKPATSYLVTDADSSQLACIEGVKKGINLVIHGPPGTGKSQTITNLFSECIAAGKSVLFVSEKMAALEVVYKRIRNAHLGNYCLELHSHKANKRQVIEELYRCYQESLQPTGGMSELEIERLMERQRKLNEYVVAIRIIRKPLNMSAYDVLDKLAGLRQVPFITVSDIKPEVLTPRRLDAAMRLSHQLARVWKVITDGKNFPWRGCNIISFTPESRSNIQILIKTCDEALLKLEESSKLLNNSLGFSVPACLAETRWLIKLSELLLEGPAVEPTWLTDPQLEPLFLKAQLYLKLASRRQEIKDELSRHFNEYFFNTPQAVQEALPSNLEEVCKLLEQDVMDNPNFLDDGKNISKWLKDCLDHLADWERDMGLLGDLLGISVEYQIADIKRLAKLAMLCSDDCRPESSWLNSHHLREAQYLLANLRKQLEIRTSLRTKILTEYNESVLSLPLEQYAESLSTRYSSPFRVLFPGFHRIRSSLRAYRVDRTNPSQMLKDIESALELIKIEKQFEADSDHIKAVFGNWFHGYDTDLAGVAKAMKVAKDILKLVGESPSHKLINQACQLKYSPQVKQAGIRLEESLVLWEEKVQEVQHLMPLDCVPGPRLPFRQAFFLDIRSWINALKPPLTIATDRLNNIMGSVIPGLKLSPAQIITDLENLAELRKIDSQINQEAKKLQEEFGSQFIGSATDWNKVLEGLKWARKIREHLGNRKVPETLLNFTKTGRDVAIPTEVMDKILKIFEHSLLDITSQFKPKIKDEISGSNNKDSYTIKRWFDDDSFEDYAFIDLHNYLQNMLNRIDELSDWVYYKAIERDFGQEGLSGLFKEFIQRPSLEPSSLPDIAQRTLLESWISWLFIFEPALGLFRAENHEAMISEFRELDSKHCKLGTSRVILEAEKRKPKNLSLQPNSEAGLLRHEANKNKRHLPIRSLFSQMPNLLTQLKPCLLMSPLTVSQFLNSQQISFDLVIFDEASQIRSEDAVGAIYRGRQLVVCGDNKQLPPTSFFDESSSDEFDEDTEEEMSADIFESILDECCVVGMPQPRLKWHYRSHHESLIAFSNRQFYKDELVTFPGSLRDDSSQGIEFIYVKDGSYDRGGKRNNIREAEAVVKLVEQHMYQNPMQSLGVVAFSVSQMEAIQDRIELLLREHPELEKYFAEDRLEGFFVKNLENVQGDERDVMIFSIGYGKDPSGRLTMNFGPLNKPGGERRLNVAITRARRKNIVVSSIKARDFDLSATQATGVLQLYHYLDYAERGPEALELRVSSRIEDCESPLERDVAGAIRELGYQVLFQVGCGKFRIDIGVIAPDEPGRFIMGVECDGATYHSAYTARDRDRLRQQVLENLGWHIHRVWSPDWISRRETEIRRLRESIEQARAKTYTDTQNTPTNKTIENPEPGVIVDVVTSAEKEVVSCPPNWVVPYEVCSPMTPPSSQYAFHDSRAQWYLASMLQDVINIEAPVHRDLVAKRIAKRWNLQKVGQRMTGALEVVINELCRKNIIYLKGDFLWRKNETNCKKVRQPISSNPESYRVIEYIPAQELQLAIECIVRDALSIPEEQLIAQVAKTFGFDRTGENIRQRVSQNIRKMVNDGRIVRNEDRLALGK